MYLTKERLRLYFFALLFLQIVLCVRLLPYVHRGQCDFRTFYSAGHMLRNGEDLYDYAAEQSAQNSLVTLDPNALPFMSPAYVALLFVPFSFLTFWPAYLTFLAFNLSLCALASVVMRPYLPSLIARWPPIVPLLFLTFMPLGVALTLGQLSILLLFLYCASFAAIESHKPFLAGILLSLTLIKFQVTLPVALLFLLWRQWRFVTGFLTGTSILTVLSLLITGPKAFAGYLHSLFFMSNASSSAAGEARYAMFPAQMPNLYGFFHSISHGASWGFILTILCSIAILLWAAIRKPSVPLALLAGTLVSYHFYLYDLTLLLLPISLVLNHSLDSLESRPEQGAFYASAFMVLSALWGSAIKFDYHHLVAIPVTILFVSFGSISTTPKPSIDPIPAAH